VVHIVTTGLVLQRPAGYWLWRKLCLLTDGQRLECLGTDPEVGGVWDAGKVRVKNALEYAMIALDGGGWYV